MNNLKDAVRQLKRRRGLSVVIIAILAIGIGVMTGIFSLFYQIVVQPLPVPEPERLVNVSSSPDSAFSYAMFRDLEARQEVFTGIAAYDEIAANFTSEGRARSGVALAVSGEYFEVLGLGPALGRLIGPQDEPALDESRVAVLSYEYWQSEFGGDPGLLGRTLVVNGQSVTIIGVSPMGFTGTTTVGSGPQVFVPLTLRFLLRGMLPDEAQDRSRSDLTAFARLRRDVEVNQASAAINTLHASTIDVVESSLDEQSAVTPRTIALTPGAQGQRTDTTATFAPPLTLLLGITLVVLLVVCSNVANLMVARGAARANEMAIRAAIGAGRRHLVSQLMAEGVLLALIGGILSLPIAVVTLDVIASIIPEGTIDELGTKLSTVAIAFAGAVTLSTVLLFGQAPVFQALRSGARLTISSPASHSQATCGTMRLRSALTTLQIAFSVVLLVLAALFAQSLANVARVNLGVDVESLATFNLAPSRSGYDAGRVSAAYEGIEEALAAQPGVASVASAAIPLITGSQVAMGVEGFDVPPGTDTGVPVNWVGPGFFGTLGVPLLAGRDFSDSDARGSPNVAIVNESFVRRFNLGNDVIGRRFRAMGGDIEIVGVAADAAYSGSGVKEDVPPQYYQPLRQAPFSLPSRHFYVRSNIGADALVRTIPGIVAGVDTNLPVDGLRTMAVQFQNDVYVDRLVTVLSGTFAVLATLLAAIGLYGMLSYSVTQRTREFGLRATLGAVPARLRAMVLKQVGAMALTGAAVGLAVTLGLGRVLEGLLFGISGYDPLAYVAAVGVVCVVAFAASYIPARRASNVAPMEALRCE